MNLLLDLFPIILFFIAYKTFNIFVATLVAIIATLLQVVYTRIKTGKYNKTSLISFVVILVLGSATIFFKNDMFIKWKASVVYWLFALTFLFSKILTKKTLLEHLANHSKHNGANITQNNSSNNVNNAQIQSQVLTMPSTVWNKLNYAWIIFFITMGIANIYVAYNFDTDTWVNFKLFGTMGCTFVFIILQSIYITKFVKN